MKLYLVWCPDRGQTQADACLVSAVDARSAACEWAKGDDQAVADYLIARGSDVTVIVAETAVPKRKVTFIVSCKCVPQYSARVVVQP